MQHGLEAIKRDQQTRFIKVVRKSHMQSLEIEELIVRHVRVGKLLVSDELVMPDSR